MKSSAKKTKEQKATRPELKKQQSKPPAKMNKPLVGYVQNLSPSKRNKGNTLTYSSFSIQTSSTQMQEALLYSPAKRALLDQSQTSRTPIKILNYTHTDDKKKIVINDISTISTPEKHEYNFQYGEITTEEMKRSTILEILNASKEWDVVTLSAKVLSLKPLKKVGTKKILNLVEATIGDETGTMPLDVWESNIDTVVQGQVYKLDRVQVSPT